MVVNTPNRFAPALGWALILGCAAPLLAGSIAHASESATVVEILDGKELFIDNQQASLKQQASAPRS